MNKQKNLVYFTLFLVGLFSLFSINISAQNSVSTTTEKTTKTCSVEKFVMPSSIAVGNDVFAEYIKVASLPLKERRIAFRELLNEQKASFFKVQFALQFIKRPNMTKDQKDFILEALSKISADLYDKDNIEKVKAAEQISQELETKAFGVFIPKDATEILTALFANKDEDVMLLQKYEDLLKAGSQARKRLVRELPINDRVNIWKTQLVYHLATGKFSKSQIDYIVEILSSISPSTFEPRANKEEEAKILEAKTLAVFSRAETFSIFEVIGIQKPVSDEPNLAPGRWCECINWCSREGASCGNSNCVRFPECGILGTSDCLYQCSP